jgi:hypothetical protein
MHSVFINVTTFCHDSADHNLKRHCPGNLKPQELRKIFTFIFQQKVQYPILIWCLWRNITFNGIFSVILFVCFFLSFLPSLPHSSQETSVLKKEILQLTLWVQYDLTELFSCCDTTCDVRCHPAAI